MRFSEASVTPARRFLNVATGLCAILCAVSYGMALYVYQPVEASQIDL